MKHMEIGAKADLNCGGNKERFFLFHNKKKKLENISSDAAALRRFPFESETCLVRIRFRSLMIDRREFMMILLVTPFECLVRVRKGFQWHKQKRRASDLPNNPHSSLSLTATHLSLSDHPLLPLLLGHCAYLHGARDIRKCLSVTTVN
jgi:hypothetical protein